VRTKLEVEATRSTAWEISSTTSIRCPIVPRDVFVQALAHEEELRQREHDNTDTASEPAKRRSVCAPGRHDAAKQRVCRRANSPDLLAAGGGGASSGMQRTISRAVFVTSTRSTLLPKKLRRTKTRSMAFSPVVFEHDIRSGRTTHVTCLPV